MLSIKRLSNDTTYYNNVFKKVEKISSVVLYLLSFKDETKTYSLLEKKLEEKSFQLHETSLKSLNAPQGSLEVLQDVRQCLIEILSTLELAAATRAISMDIAAMLSEHVDAVHRYLTNHYLQSEGVSIEALHQVSIENTTTKNSIKAPARSVVPKQRRQQRVSVPAGDISTDAYMVYSQLTDRADRIKTVLEAKPNATVKDVAEIITDVSEKTIQRELNSLIEKGQVIREGERRWSRYSVVKD